jgi:hypothetical protein
MNTAHGDLLAHDDYGIRFAVTYGRIARGINLERRRRNRAIRAVCRSFLTYAPLSVMQVTREHRRGRVIRVVPRGAVLAHADLLRAIRTAGLTHAEERCFRRVMLACDTRGEWIVRPDEHGRLLVRPLSLAECAEEYDLPEATVRRYVARAFAKIRVRFFGNDEEP